MRLSDGMLVVVLAGSITVDACTLFTGPKSHPTTLSVTSDTLVAVVRQSGDITWTQFTLPVSIHNGYSGPLTVDFCLLSVSAVSGAVVWTPICALQGSAALPSVASGATTTFQWPVYAAISGPSAPKWESPTLGGSYRVRLVIDAEHAVMSNVFVISPSTAASH